MKGHRVFACVSAASKLDWRAACAAVALSAVLGSSPASQAADAGNWIGAWATSPQPAWGPDFPVPLGMPANLWKQTIRQNARLGIAAAECALCFRTHTAQRR